MAPRTAPRDPTPDRKKLRTTTTAKRLTAARIAADLTQAAAAVEIGVSLRTFVSWETGKAEPRGKLQTAAVAAFLAAHTPKRRPQ